jgi:DNA mismatch repair protein MLH1
MIDEYFSINVTSGIVSSIPLLLKGYTPNLDRLPHFLLCLATRVDWEDEKRCFETVLRELAFFYSPRPFDDTENDANGEGGEGDGEGQGEGETETSQEAAHQLWQLEHVLFPAFRRVQWPRTLSDRDVSQVANLPDLFRVFERC